MIWRASSLGAFFLLLVFVIVPMVDAEEWSRAYINALPDSAFAAIETTPDGKTVRHLPHHDAGGALDIPHLRSARARITQVKWADPANEARARGHLDQHWQEYLEFLKRGRHGQ